jgi:predicted RNA-binding Zn-ribbon protein involved in translation (DUF1610 family)
MKSEPTQASESPKPSEEQPRNKTEARVFFCDRCGARMIEHDCKIICRNCGHRFDCSDLNIYFD